MKNLTQKRKFSNTCLRINYLFLLVNINGEGKVICYTFYDFFTNVDHES